MDALHPPGPRCSTAPQASSSRARLQHDSAAATSASRTTGRSAARERDVLGDFYTEKYYGFRPSCGAAVRRHAVQNTCYTIWDPTVDHWRWQTAGQLVSDDIAPKVRGVVTWLNFSDPNFFQEFNRNFALGSTRSLTSEGFLTWGPDPWALNLRLSREEAIGFGDGSSVVSERLPTLEARLRPTPFFGQSVFLEVLAQGGVLHVDRGPGCRGTYDRFDLFPR